MILAKEQRIGALILFGIAIIAWIVMALYPSTPPSPETPKKKSWAERKDSIRLADSLRYVQWREEREQRYDSFRMADSLRHEAWKIERQQRILEEAYRLFSEKSIEGVTMPEVAEASGVGRATVYRYYPTKLDLVVAIGTWTWNEYIRSHGALLTQEEIEEMSGAEYLRFFMDGFLDLYRNHGDLLRFNYDFNSYLRSADGSAEQKQPYMRMVDNLGQLFHTLYEKGQKDGTLRSDIPEVEMFSGSFHIMLAAVTRYAVGLVYVPESGADPENELMMLKDLLLSHYCVNG